jgi:tRNA-modifying protein YgfZ
VRNRVNRGAGRQGAAGYIRTMTDMPRRCAPDPDRRILRVAGPDRLKFVQGLVTNDINRLGPDGLIYAAMLSPQGKYLTDFFLFGQPDAVLIDAPAPAADDLLRRLTLFRLRAAVQIESTNLPVTRGLGPAPAGARPDPRHPDLGWRLCGESLIEGDPVDWPALQVALRVPEHGADLIPGDSYILEMGFERLHGVDFRKGCYVGQEVTARMQHKTALRKQLVTVRLDGPAETGTPILTEDGREAGRLGTVAGDRALAFLRLDRAQGALRAGTATLAALLTEAHSPAG